MFSGFGFSLSDRKTTRSPQFGNDKPLRSLGAGPLKTAADRIAKAPAGTTRDNNEHDAARSGGPSVLLSLIFVFVEAVGYISRCGWVLRDG
jgi:hypothetical protein